MSGDGESPRIPSGSGAFLFSPERAAFSSSFLVKIEQSAASFTPLRSPRRGCTDINLGMIWHFIVDIWDHSNSYRQGIDGLVLISELPIIRSTK